jgi:S-adenosylmethionine/arginine decarboxylase-like enzyme
MENQSTPIINHFSAIINLENLNNDLLHLDDAIDSLIGLLNLHVVKKINYNFEPIGKTFVYILSESHLAVHTWPEYQLLHLDLVTCSHLEKINVEDAIKQSFATLGINNLKLANHEI